MGYFQPREGKNFAQSHTASVTGEGGSRTQLFSLSCQRFCHHYLLKQSHSLSHGHLGSLDWTEEKTSPYVTGVIICIQTPSPGQFENFDKFRNGRGFSRAHRWQRVQGCLSDTWRRRGEVVEPCQGEDRAFQVWGGEQQPEI